MALKWYPIDPVLTEEGAFFAFAQRENATDLKPVSLEPGEAEFKVLEVLQDFLSVKQALDLGVGPFGSLSETFNGAVLTYEVMAYSEKTVTKPIGGEIYGTRWGAGVRLAVAVGNVTGAADLNIGMVAAKTELGTASSSFRMTVYGVHDMQLLKLVPGPGPFDINSYTQILDATKAIKDRLGDSQQQQNLKLVPIQVLMQSERPSTLLDDSQSVVFAMRRLARGKSFKQAREESLVKGYSADVIRAAYQSIVHSFEESASPSDEERRAARRWLEA